MELIGDAVAKGNQTARGKRTPEPRENSLIPIIKEMLNGRRKGSQQRKCALGLSTEDKRGKEEQNDL